jgi:FkbM family methyltransferase
MSLRVKLIQRLINFNENLFFYPKLKKFYSAKLNSKIINIIDVGSNKGQSIDFFCRINQSANVFGFEPNPSLYKKLVKKYQRNSKIKLINLGISNKVGKLIFYENLLDETSSFESLNPESVYLKKKSIILGVNPKNIIVDSYEVEVTTLDIFIKEHPTTFFDVLKIDVEGHELNCIKGLFSTQRSKYPIKYIQIERHNDDMYLNEGKFEEINILLLSQGYKHIAEFKHGFGDFYEIIYENINL